MHTYIDEVLMASFSPQAGHVTATLNSALVKAPRPCDLATQASPQDLHSTVNCLGNPRTGALGGISRDLFQVHSTLEMMNLSVSIPCSANV